MDTIKPFSEDISYGQNINYEQETDMSEFGLTGPGDYDYFLSEEILKAAQRGKKHVKLSDNLRLTLTDNIVEKAKIIQNKGMPSEAKNVLIKNDGTIVLGTKAGKPMNDAQFARALEKNKVIRIGVPPVRLEVITSASGVNFDKCYSNREVFEIDGIPINIISLEDLKKNKSSVGRHKDLDDIEHLP